MLIHWVLVTYISYACPGGWFSGLVPQAARPFVCTASYKHEAYPKLVDAQARVSELGKDAFPGLTQVWGTRLKELPVTWESVVKF